MTNKTKHNLIETITRVEYKAIKLLALAREVEETAGKTMHAISEAADDLTGTMVSAVDTLTKEKN